MLYYFMIRPISIYYMDIFMVILANLKPELVVFSLTGCKQH